MLKESLQSGYAGPRRQLVLRNLMKGKEVALISQ
jgi:hypothetical protein